MFNASPVRQEEIRHIFVASDRGMKQRCTASSVLAVTVCSMFQQETYDPAVAFLHCHVDRTRPKPTVLIAHRSGSRSFISAEVLPKNVGVVARIALEKLLNRFRLGRSGLRAVDRRIVTWACHPKRVNGAEIHIIWDRKGVDFMEVWTARACWRPFILQPICTLTFRQNDSSRASSIGVQTAVALTLICGLSFTVYLLISRSIVSVQLRS